ncbi:hypothetical protein MTO96_018171 [Rhipicephalus appendiculatus]
MERPGSKRCFFSVVCLFLRRLALIGPVGGLVWLTGLPVSPERDETTPISISGTSDAERIDHYAATVLADMLRKSGLNRSRLLERSFEVSNSQPCFYFRSLLLSIVRVIV